MRVPCNLPRFEEDFFDPTNFPTQLAGAKSLIDELERATHEASPARRVEMLRNVTDLFIGGAERISQDQVDLFGDVLGQLISDVERQALSELSVKLAPIGNAPKTVIHSLASNDDIMVAGPVLARSSQLSDHDLIEIAQTKGQRHLSSISERQKIAAAVTDILVERGNSEVLRKVSGNSGASFSSAAFQRLTTRAANDEGLAENLVRRMDLPPGLLEDLISQATEAVRTRMLATARPSDRDAIQVAVATASVKLLLEAAAPRDFSRAQDLIAKMVDNGQLNEAAIYNFANARQYEEIVVGIAHLTSAPVKLIDQLLSDARHEGVLVLGKAASLHWSTLRAILINRFTHRQLSEVEIGRARFDFIRLTAETARRALRFWAIRGHPVANRHNKPATAQMS